MSDQDNFPLLYAATRRALDRVHLDPNERRLMGVILDFSFGWNRPWMRCNGHHDLVVLTGIERKNQPASLKSLSDRRMLIVRRAARNSELSGRDLILEPLPDIRKWDQVDLRIDEVVYYRLLAGLRVLNGCTPLRCSQDEMWPAEATLKEALGEVSRESARDDARRTAPSETLESGTGGTPALPIISNLPTRGEAAQTWAADPLHQVRSEPRVAVGLSGANRESAEAKTQMDVGGAPKAPLTFTQMAELRWSEEQVSAYMAEHPEMLARSASANGEYSQGKEQAGVLMVSTPGTDGKYPAAPNERAEAKNGGWVLTVSTLGTYGKYPVPKMAKSASSASGVSLGERGSDIPNNVPMLLRRSTITMLTMFLKRVRARELVLERGSRKLVKYLEEAGVFDGPAGEYYAPFWFKHLKIARQQVEDCFFDMIQKVQEQGVRSIESPGQFMMFHMKNRNQRRVTQ